MPTVFVVVVKLTEVLQVDGDPCFLPIEVPACPKTKTKCVSDFVVPSSGVNNMSPRKKAFYSLEQGKLQGD